MAKRRRLVAPGSEDLAAIEEGFAAKPKVNPFESAQTAAPPIAKVAAEAAQLHGMSAVADRVELAKDKADAEKFREAENEGRMVQMIALSDIDRDYLRRDRMDIDEEEMQELLFSIRTNGLRSPIEVVALEQGFGLVSGFRRLEAFTRLAHSGAVEDAIPAFVRHGQDGAQAYVSMIEENELRANLSPYERGRVAVLAAGQGVFASVEDAVDQLFAAASKAKRSKVRSFALVHQSLGDLLRFPSLLSEKAGLKIAAAVRAGGQGALREALDHAPAENAKDELELLEQAMTALTPVADTSRGGRPQKTTRLEATPLNGGGELRAEFGSNGLRIDLKGRKITSSEAERVMEMIERYFAET